MTMLSRVLTFGFDGIEINENNVRCMYYSASNFNAYMYLFLSIIALLWHRDAALL